MIIKRPPLTATGEVFAQHSGDVWDVLSMAGDDLDNSFWDTAESARSYQDPGQKLYKVTVTVEEI